MWFTCSMLIKNDLASTYMRCIVFSFPVPIVISVVSKGCGLSKIYKPQLQVCQNQETYNSTLEEARQSMIAGPTSSQCFPDLTRSKIWSDVRNTAGLKTSRANSILSLELEDLDTDSNTCAKTSSNASRGRNSGNSVSNGRASLLHFLPRVFQIV